MIYRIISIQRSLKILLVSLLQFPVTSALAMIFYTGGNFNAPEQIRYQFSQNLFSDLGLIQGYNGNVNLISPLLFLIALSWIGIGFIPFFFAIPSFFPKKSLNRVIANISKYLAIIAGIGYIGVGLTPHTLVPQIHNFMVAISFSNSAFIGLLYSIIILFSPGIKKKYVIGFLLMITAVIAYPVLTAFFQQNFPTIWLYVSVLSQKFAVYAKILAFAWFGWGLKNFSCKNQTKKIPIFNFSITQEMVCPAPF